MRLGVVALILVCALFGAQYPRLGPATMRRPRFTGVLPKSLRGRCIRYHVCATPPGATGQTCSLANRARVRVR